ncbi:hypothetical protein F5146DRAFT_1190781 [Armillaria mellea]|nr:hypothetical protein F5146DRAFT_1190781 [Armillaria mellea]
MVTQIDIPSDLTDDDKACIFQLFDAQLNSTILYALLHGIYTGILAITLWNMFINKSWPIRRAMVVVIVLLHVLITISFAATWSYIDSAFIVNGQSLWTVYLQLSSATQVTYWETGIAASLSTIVADFYLIWSCWMVLGRRWPVLLLPTSSLASAIVSRAMKVYCDYVNAPSDVFNMLYISFSLATSLSCTLLIVYRIMAVAGVRRGAVGRLRVYYRFIEVLVESSALYSISLILDLAFTICNDSRTEYLDIIAAIAKGIAPTLLVGRITVGHRARPDDSWEGSVIASASIRSQGQEHSRTNSRGNGTASLVPDGDIEAQRESGAREPSPIFFPGPAAQSQDVVTLPEFENFPLYHLGNTEGSIRASIA